MEHDIQVEDADGKEYQWRTLGDFAINTSVDDSERQVSEVLEINRIIRYFWKILFKEKIDFSEKEELRALVHQRKHVKLFKEGTFSWELVFDNMDSVLTFIKPTFSKFSSTIDFEMIDHRLFQKLFPIQLINEYLSVVNRTYGKPVYDKALRFQTNLLETFLWHHLEADTCFSPKITTPDINLIDPFMRIKIRERNREDTKLKAKYFSKDFDIKQFTYKLLDLYFPNVTWRYIGASQEMHRWSLLLMLRMFELGLFKAEEMHGLLNLLLQKLENLLVLEKRSYKDFTTTLQNYPRFIETLKAYFYECKEIVASICIQIIVLLNDHDFSSNHPLYTSGQPSTNHWQRAYFTDSSVSNYINRIMTTYLLQFNNTAENSQKESLFSMLNQLIKLSTADTSDIYTESASVVDRSLLDFYASETSPQDIHECQNLKDQAIEMLNMVTRENDQMQRAELETCLIGGLKKFLVQVGQRRAREKSLNFLHLLGFEGVANIMLALHNGILELKLSKEVEKIIGLALIVLCQDSKLNQISILGKAAMKHWDLMFNSNPMIAVVLQTSIFDRDYRVYFAHHTAMKSILNHFGKALERTIKLRESESKKYDDWIASLISNENPHESAVNMDNLVIFYSYCRFLASMIAQRDENFENRFFSFEIQRILGADFFEYFLPIIKNADFLNKGTFKPLLEVSSTPELTSLVSKCTDNSLLVDHIKGAVFEVAMLTMKLLNRACSGLYLYYLYRNSAKPAATTLLEDTRYLLELPETGILYRGYVLDFMTHFKVFPNNGVLTFRSVEFQEGNPVNRESRVLLNHMDGSLITEISKEIECYGRVVERLGSMSEMQVKGLSEYYFASLLPMLYKYCHGLYTTYTQTPESQVLMDHLLDLRTMVESVPVLLGTTSTSIGALISLDTLSPKTRLPDMEEKLYPSVGVIRDTLSLILTVIDTIYQNNRTDPIATSAYEYLLQRYQRESAIQSTAERLEPWKNRKSRRESHRVEVEDNNMKAFRDMILEYRKNKIAELDKPDDSNTLTKFLQSEADYIPNMITFLDRLIERNFNKLSIAAQETTKEAFENMDYLVSTFLEQDILFTVIKFFSKVLKSCESVRDGFYQNTEDVRSASRFSLTITYACLGLMSQLASNKTFIDSEYELIEERVSVLSDFFQYLCFGSSKQNKNLLGTFVPSTPGLPHINKAKKSLFYDCYVRTETQLGGFNVWSNSSTHFVVSDRPEYLKQIMNLLKIVTECCTGPCNANQNQIYIFRSDMYTGIIRRSVDYVNSTLYPVKNRVIDYISALTEGDDKAIVSHFAGNITFDELFDLICSSIKRLVVHFVLSQDKPYHQKLLRELDATHLSKQRAKLTEDESLKTAREEELEFYLDDIIEANKETSNPTFSLHANPLNRTDGSTSSDPNIITDELMDHFKIESYEQIMKLYNTDLAFACHPLMVIAQKLNEFLNKFIKYVPGYRFSLQNIYSKIAFQYRESTPQYILDRITTSAPQSTTEVEENIMIYMFMCKVNEEIHRWDYTSKSKVSIMFPVPPKYYSSKDIQAKEHEMEAILEYDTQNSSQAEKEASMSFELYHRLGRHLVAKHSKDRNLFKEYLVKHYERTKRHLSNMFVPYTKVQHPLEAAHFQSTVLEGITELKAQIEKLKEKADQLELNRAQSPAK